MSETSDHQSKRPDDLPEYMRFLALLVVFLVVILGVAWLSPRLIGEVTPAVLGLSGAPVDVQEPAVQEGLLDESQEPATLDGFAASESTDAMEQQAGTGVEETGIRHEVQEGETLFQLAALYGVSMQEIAAANNIINPNQLAAGTVLIIPQSR